MANPDPRLQRLITDIVDKVITAIGKKGRTLRERLVLKIYDKHMLHEHEQCYHMGHSLRVGATMVTMTGNRDAWQALSSLFRYLDVESQFYFCCQGQELIEEMKTNSSKEQNSVDCLILLGNRGTMLEPESYQNKEYLFTADRHDFFIRESNRAVLRNNEYQSLIDKPKIVVVQTCRADSRGLNNFGTDTDTCRLPLARRIPDFAEACITTMMTEQEPCYPTVNTKILNILVPEIPINFKSYTLTDKLLSKCIDTVDGKDLLPAKYYKSRLRGHWELIDQGHFGIGQLTECFKDTCGTLLHNKTQNFTRQSDIWSGILCLLLYRWALRTFLVFLYLALAQISSAVLVEKGNHEEFLRSSCLPNNLRNVRGIQKHYTDILAENLNMKSTWVPIQRRDLGGWYWLSGDYEGVTLSANPVFGRDCGLLRAFDMLLDDVDCSRKYQKYLCQKPDSGCLLNESSCFVYNQTRYTMVLERADWYEARARCKKRGEILASVPQKSRQQILSKLKKLSISNHEIWLGLRKKDYYMDIDKHNTYVNLFFWREGDTCPCKSSFNCVSLERTKQNAFFWMPRNCSDKISFLVCVTTTKSDETFEKSSAAPKEQNEQGTQNYTVCPGNLCLIGFIIASVLLLLCTSMLITSWIYFSRKQGQQTQAQRVMQIHCPDHSRAHGPDRGLTVDLHHFKDVRKEDKSHAWV